MTRWNSIPSWCFPTLAIGLRNLQNTRSQTLWPRTSCTWRWSTTSFLPFARLSRLIQTKSWGAALVPCVKTYWWPKLFVATSSFRTSSKKNLSSITMESWLTLRPILAVMLSVFKTASLGLTFQCGSNLKRRDTSILSTKLQKSWISP